MTSGAHTRTTSPVLTPPDGVKHGYPPRCEALPPWPPEQARAFWERVAYQRMTAKLAVDGRKPFVFDEHVAAVEEALHTASAGEYLAPAFQGLREGFLYAAEDYWSTIAVQAGVDAARAAPILGDDAVLDLQYEVTNWSRVPDLGAHLSDLVRVTIGRAFLQARAAMPRSTGVTPPRHARKGRRKQPR